MAPCRRTRYSFQYDSSWLEHPQARPLSWSLPLRNEAFEEKECAGFFGGLLPEDYNRELVARNLGITSTNDYAMLKAIGGECAGAVALLDPDEDLPVREHAYHPVAENELAAILDSLPRKPLLAGEAEVRLSLAGAQNKLSLYRDGTGFALPLHELPSSHILKPESSLFPGLVENEAYCLRLARQAGLPATGAESIGIGPHRCLLVERYDRRVPEGTLQRLHQEDFCQALGVSSRYKYQAEGGPSLVQCFDLVRRASSRPARDLVSLFEAVLFNHLIGNHDGHGKNFSLLHVPAAEGILLAGDRVLGQAGPQANASIPGPDRPDPQRLRDLPERTKDPRHCPGPLECSGSHTFFGNLIPERVPVLSNRITQHCAPDS